MLFEFSFTIKLLFVNTIILIALAIYTYRYRTISGGIYMFYLLIADSIWSFSSAYELMSDTVVLKVFWSKISYFGVTSSTLFLFIFILFFCGYGKRLKLKHYVLLWVIPAISLIAALTNDFHGLIWTSVNIIPNETGFGAKYHHGVLFWLLIVYCYILLVIGTVLAIRTAYKSLVLYRKQLYILIFALVPPWIGNLIYLSGLSPYNLDLTPITFSVTGLIIVLGVIRYQLLNIEPFAYDTLFKSMTNGVVVLDSSMRLINYNKSILNFIQFKEKHIGKQIQNIAVLEAEILNFMINSKNEHIELMINKKGFTYWLDIKSSTILSKKKEPIGKIFVFWDISENKKAEESIKKSEKIFSLINACLVNLTVDYKTNINSLTKICGEILGATCALYNKIDEEMLCSLGQWNTPNEYNPKDNPEGHICYDVIKEGSKNAYLVFDLQNSSYNQTDPNVRLYGLKTYAGHAVFCDNQVVGSLCVVFQEDKELDKYELGVLSIIASALSSEEQRLRDKTALSKSEEKYHEMSTLFRLMADNMSDMLWAKNLNQEYIFANKAMCDKLLNAVDINEPIGKTDEYFAKRERESHLESADWHTFGKICANTDIETLNQLKPISFDEYGYVKGQFMYLDVQKAPILNNSGEVIGVVGSARDVTAIKKVEIQNRKLSQAVEQSPSSVVITDLKGSIEYVNTKFCQVTGYTSEEAIGKSPNILKSGKHSVEFYKELWQTIQSGKEWKGTFLNKKKNGELFWELAIISPLVNEKGEITNYITIKEDITEDKLTQEQLILTKNTYQSIFNSVNESIYVLDENGVFVDVNKGAEIMYGYTKEELIGKTPEFVSASGLNDLDLINTIMIEVFKTGISQRFEFWGKRKNSQIFPKEVIVNRGNYFGKEYIIATARDITERKRTEITQIIQYNVAQASQSSSNIQDFLKIVQIELGSLINTNNFYVALLKSDNNALETIFFENEMYEYENWEIGHIITQEVIKTGKTAFIKGNEISEYCKIYNIEATNSDLICSIGIPILIQKNIVGLYVIQHFKNPNEYSNSDVSLLEMVAYEIGIFIEKQKMIEDLVSAKVKAEESDRLKTAFLQNMSHEVRTPLNSIIGFSELINNVEIDANIRKFYTDIIIERGWHLTEIINDILTISSIETKQEQLFIDAINVNELINEHIMLFNEQANKKGLKLIPKCKLKEEDAEIYADKTKIGQILSNFFTNALKFTNEGEIELGCRKKDMMLEFYVKDTGIGIDSSKHKLIFDRFVQADDTIRRNYGGTGLGLSICEGFVKLMGGEIWVESEIGKGSTFSFSIPYQAVEKTKNDNSDIIEEINFANKTLNVLIAEDEEVNYLYLNLLLKKYNFNIYKANNGQEAVDICKQEKIDLILMDIKMPIMDGFTAAKIIKDLKPKIIIIAQTAHAAQSEIELFKDVFDDYITKPFTAEKLSIALSKLLLI